MVTDVHPSYKNELRTYSVAIQPIGESVYFGFKTRFEQNGQLNSAAYFYDYNETWTMRLIPKRVDVIGPNETIEEMAMRSKRNVEKAKEQMPKWKGWTERFLPSAPENACTQKTNQDRRDQSEIKYLRRQELRS